MNLTLKVKLCPTEEQHTSLLETMERFNEACNYVAEVAYENRMANKIALQKILYYDVRERFRLSAQMAIRAIAKVVEVYKRDKSIKPKFKPHGAIVYDQRILTWKALDRVSILTLKGRELISTVIYDYFENRATRVRGQADLIYVKGIFYLCVIVEVPDGTTIETHGVLGVDLGIVNLAVDSDCETFSGEKVDEVRSKTMKLRAKLQKVGTKSAKRHLKRLSRKESRFHRDINHCISKNIVAKAKRTGRAIALEELRGIMGQIRARKAQRGRQHSWGFDQLRGFIEYKSALAGVPVILVDPRGTSHICPSCGHNERRNRPSRDDFKCVQCGFAGPADHVAAINIAVRASVNTPIVSGCLFEHSVPPQLQAHCL